MGREHDNKYNTIGSTYFNDGLNLDPYPSPGGIYPFSASDENKHAFITEGEYIITLTVTDDDLGVTVKTIAIKLI